MDGDLILYCVIALFILFIFIVPPLLYAGLKKFRDPVPVCLPVILSILVVGVLAGIRASGIISAENTLVGTVISFFLLLLLVDLAVIAPFPYFGKKIGITNPWMIFSLPAFIGAYLLFYTTAGEMYVGQPLPPLSAPLPLTGWILDGVVSVLGLQETMYAFGSPVYAILREIGLWFEVFIVAIVYYGVLSILQKPEPAGR